MTEITTQLVLSLNPRHPNATVAAQKLNWAASRYGITTPRTVAMFLSQLAHESGLVPQEENLYYSAARLMVIWPARFPTLTVAQQYARNPQALANYVYGGRMGNTQPGDGWLFRGRGLHQITGRSNYTWTGRVIGHDLISNPDVMAREYGLGALAAGAYWLENRCNVLAERGDVRAVTLAINGGLNGLSDREILYRRALRALPRVGLGLLASSDTHDPEELIQADLTAAQDAFERTLAALH